MTSLQQVLQAPIVVDPGTVLAIHRRSVTLLLGSENVVYTTRQDNTGKWIVFNKWTIPSNTGRILGYFSLEAYSCFVLLLECAGAAVSTFLDLSGVLMNSWPVARLQLDSWRPCAVDVDQNRRELILSTSRNDMYSVALRNVVHEQKKGVTDISHDTVLFEAMVRMKGHLNPRTTPPAILLVCCDLQGSYCTLNDDGLIMGFESSSLDILWALEPHNFLYKPAFVFANRFGPGFFVYSRSLKSSRLEFWASPDTSVGCNTGTFTRAVVPMTAPLSCLSVESLGKDLGTYAVVVQADRQVFLWKIVGKSKVVLDAKITLTNGHEEVFRELTVEKAVRRMVKQEKAQEKLGQLMTKMTLRSALPGIVTFSPASGIPDSPMTITVTVGNIFAFISMHIPRQSDFSWLGWTHDEIRAGLEDLGARRERSKHTEFGMLESRFNLNETVQDHAVRRAASDRGDGNQPRVTFPNSDGDRSQGEEEEIVLKSAVGPDAVPVATASKSSAMASARNEGGELVCFAPLTLVDSAAFAAGRRSLAVNAREGTLGLVLPASVIATTSIKSNGKTSAYQCDVRMIQRGGLFAPHDLDNVEASVSLDVLMGACAYRSRKYVVLTTMKELFWMALPANDTDARRVKPPVKVGLNIKAANVNVSCLAVGDVFMKLPADKLGPEISSSINPGAAVVAGGIIGSWTATFVGDSTGNVHFFLAADDGIVQQGQFLAHKSNSIVAVLMTGDTMRSLWRLGATNAPVSGSSEENLNLSGRFVSSNNKLKMSKGGVRATQLRCVAVPGSALVTVARDGEVKVWQPVFTQLPHSKADVNELLNIYEISWRISGVFSGLGNPYLYISSASLDPTCMTIMLATSNGFILQWPLPGLVETNSGSLSTCRDSIASYRRHDTSITTMRVWIDAPITSVHDVPMPSSTNHKEGKFAAMVRGPLSGTIGYTTQDLQHLSGNSTLISSATDRSLVLWRFSLSKVFQGPDSLFGGSRYLTPTPCRRLFFSSIPRDGICFPVIDNDAVMTAGGSLKATGSTRTWRVSTLLNGVVVTAAQAPYYTLFDATGFNGEQTGATLETALMNTSMDEGVNDDQEQVEPDEFDTGSSTKPGSVLQMMPVSVMVVKPSRLAIIAPRAIGDKINSWTLLNTEWLHRNAEDQANTQLETSLKGVGEFASKVTDTFRLFETFQGSRPSSANNEAVRRRDHSKSPDHHRRTPTLPDSKVDVGVDGEISVMKGVRLPDDVPDKPSPIRNDGLVPVMKNGFHVLVTANQLDNVSAIVANSATENNRMVYISPEKRMEVSKTSHLASFDMDSTLYSSLNTPVVSNTYPEPISPVASSFKFRAEIIDMTHSLDHIQSPSSAKLIVSQSPYTDKNSASKRRTTLPEGFSPKKPEIIDDKSLAIDLQSRHGDISLGGSQGSLGHGAPQSAAKSVVGRVPAIGDRASAVLGDIMMSPPASIDLEDNTSIDSEFDPTYIEATMSLMSSSAGVVDGKDSQLISKNSEPIVVPRTPSKLPKQGQVAGKGEVVAHLPFDDEAPVVEIETIHFRDDSSDVSDLDIVLHAPEKATTKTKVLSAAEKRSQKFRYISKPRMAGPKVGGKVVLQPYVTPKVGFVPSKGFYEQKIAESEKRVVVEKVKKEKPKSDFTDSFLDTDDDALNRNDHKLSRTTVGIVSEGDQLILGKSTEFVQNDKYFNWASDPLFLLRGPMTYVDEADAGFDVMNAIPDDHAMFSKVEKTITQEEILKDLSQLESSQLKRMGEEEKNMFLQNKAEDHEREVEASKHFFREMLGEAASKQSTAGGPKKRNALQKTTLSINHLKKWEFINKAIAEGVVSHGDLDEILLKAVQEEREVLTTAEREKSGVLVVEQQESFQSAESLDAQNYSDTESETSLSKGGSLADPGLHSFDFAEEENDYSAVNIDSVSGMEGAETRPATAKAATESQANDSDRKSPFRSGRQSSAKSPLTTTQTADKLVKFMDHSATSPPQSAHGESIAEAFMSDLISSGKGQVLSTPDGGRMYVSAAGEKYIKSSGSNYYVKIGTRRSPELAVTAGYKSAGIEGGASVSELRPGSMVSREARDKLSRTPKKRKPLTKKHNFSFEDDSGDDDESLIKNAFLQKGKSTSNIAFKGKAKLKNIIRTAVMKKTGDENINDVVNALTSHLSPPAEGEITFLGFSKFLKAVNAKVADAARPPEVHSEVVSVLHDCVTLKLKANKRCCVWAIVTNAGSNYVPSNTDFDNLNGLMSNPEVVAMNAGIIGEEDEDQLWIEMPLRILKAEKKYKIYYCSDLEKNLKMKTTHKEKYSARTPDIVIEDEAITVKTIPEPPENLDIEWNKLTLKQQEMEVRAAARSFSVQAAAKLDGKSIPSDEDIIMKNKPAQIPAMKKWTTFVSWWTGGDLTAGFSAPRIEFQSNEIIFAVKDDTLRMRCHVEGYISDTDLNNINAYLFDMEGVDMNQGGVVPTEGMSRQNIIDPSIFDDLSFQFFRSWYKGGRVCERQQFWNSRARQMILEMAEREIEEMPATPNPKVAKAVALTDDGEDISVSDSMTDATSGITGQFKVVLSDLPFNAEEGKRSSANQLIQRAALLQDRIQYVEAQKQEAMKLLDCYKHCEKESLRFGDLQSKRNTLNKHDIDSLMGSKKLSELCRLADVEIFRLPGNFMQRVSKADIFLNSPPDYLVPDRPPPMIKGSAEGGGKIPVKFWTNCTDVERELECRIACMLDKIAELAIMDGIYVPNIEDADVDDSLVPVRSHKWKRFVEWYAGPERVGAEADTFSKARLEFSDWERRVAGSNFNVHLKILGKPPSILSLDDRAKPRTDDDDATSVGETSVRTQETIESTVMSMEMSVEASHLSLSAQADYIKKQQEQVVDVYTDTVNTQSGAEMRVDLFLEYVLALNSSRYASVMRCMWPSAPPRQSLQFMFPRMGIITPEPEAHTLHMKLYASRKNEGYTINDIMKFYTIDELNDDDVAMQKAEQKGKKFEEYIVWLSKEKDRVAEGRDMMLAEDIAGLKFRIMQDNLARNLAEPKGNPHFSAFSMAGPLPGAYDDINDGLPIFADGDGCLNEDEIFDIKDDMIRRAREGFQALQEKKKQALEDQKKAEERERIRADKREREKRIQEGVVRRQNIRAKLALLKEERDLKAMCDHRDKLLAEEEEQKILARELVERMTIEKHRAEIENEVREMEEMGAEEFRQRTLEDLIRNRANMEEEDNLSHIREDMDAYAEEFLAEKLKDLKELYTSLEPFPFKKRRAQTGWLDIDEKHEFYQRVKVPTLPSGSRFPPEKKARQPKPTVLLKGGIVSYPASESTKIHTSGSPKHIRYPTITVKETRFDSPPRYPSHIVDNKTATILSKTAPNLVLPVTRMPDLGFRSPGEEDSDRDNVANPMVNRPHRAQLLYRPAQFLPAVAHHAQSTPNLQMCSYNESNDTVGTTMSSIDDQLQLPVLVLPRNQKSNRSSHLKKCGNITNHKRIGGAGKDDLTYVISRDISGLQNRKKLLRASLSGLDWKKEFVKAPQARVKYHLHQSSDRLVERVKRERDDIRAYLSEANPQEVLEDKYYAMACEPGLREKDSVNANSKDLVVNFRASLFKNLADIEEAEFNIDPSSVEAAYSPNTFTARRASVTVASNDLKIDSPQVLDDDISVNDAAVVGQISSDAAEITGEVKFQTTPTRVTARPITSKTTSSRATTALSIPEELPLPISKIDYRQINVPPPFYKKTFGILGAQKMIGSNPKWAGPTTDTVSSVKEEAKK